MISELHIENFAIIEELEASFEDGLVTFTGETGAGKSIIIDAVDTLLGGRAETMHIRSGAERANIEAVFKIQPQVREEIHTILKNEDLLEDPDYLTLGREIRLTGRNVARVNGHSVSASLLREIGEYLVDVHGQSEHLSLLRVNQHINLLDRFAAADPNDQLENQRKKYRQTFADLELVQKELQKIRQDERDAARQSDMLNFQIAEIEGAHLQKGEEEQLIEERNRLANAEGLASLTQAALQALDEGTPEAPAATDLVGQATDSITGLVRLDPSQENLSENAQILFEGLSELSRNLRIYLDSIEFSPKRLDQVEERLALIQTLRRKYGDSIPEILSFLEKAKIQLESITHASERIIELEKEQAKLLDQLGMDGLSLSHLRHAAAKKLESMIESELAGLRMSGAGFKVDFIQKDDPSGVKLPDGRQIAFYANGLERVEYLIAPNPGEGYKPLAKIASGGETSRLMLALKNVLAQADHVHTLIFDEIDQGIGGRVGTIVGQKLQHLGRDHQVLCITHLPQLAAFGKQHFRVEKQIHQGRTITSIKILKEQDRLMELAQMLGDISEGTLRSAHELLQAASKQTEDA